MTTPTQLHVPHFVERNLFLAALLGLHSTASRLEQWVVAQADAGARSNLPPLPKGSPFFDALLGSVSVARQLRRHLDLLVAESSEPPQPIASPRPWLRSLLK